MSRRLKGLLADTGVSENTNRRARLEAMRILRLAMRQELTQRQRTCLLLYYEDGLTIPQIADRLGLNRSTVSRHIQKALQRLQKTAHYARLSD